MSVLSQISNCQGLGRKNKHDILKTDRIFLAASRASAGWRVLSTIALALFIPVLQETATTETLNPIQWLSAAMLRVAALVFCSNACRKEIIFLLRSISEIHRVFLGRDPGTLKSDIVSKKTSTINLFGFETLKLKIRRLKLWKATVPPAARKPKQCFTYYATRFYTPPINVYSVYLK